MQPILLINSCFKYYLTTVPVLMESLIASGVPVERIHIVVGETPNHECRDDTFMMASIHFVQYANMDNNALFWLALDASPFLQPGDWVFYLHDTCTVEPYFWTKLCDKGNEESFLSNHVAGKIHGQGPSMCIGWYSVRALRDERILDAICADVNTDGSPDRVLAIKNDLHKLVDHVFRLLETIGAVWAYPNTCKVVERDVQMYGTPTLRIVELYEDPGIIKYKANHDPSRLHIRL
jgi:hypothetical protein